MNIVADIMKNFRSKQTSEDADELEKPWAPKHGPQRLRFLTNGQVRRIQQRDQARQRRKTARNSRRSFMDRRLRVAVVRGQLQAAGVLPVWDGLKQEPNAKIVEHLNEQYGSVDKALELYREATAVRA